jgi:hypothetical protein
MGRRISGITKLEPNPSFDSYLGFPIAAVRIFASESRDDRAVVNPYSRFIMRVCGASKIDTDTRDIEKVQ